MKLTDAMIVSSKGISIISSHSRRRYEPEQLNAKRLGASSVVFNASAGVSGDEKRGYWGFVAPYLKENEQ